MEVVLYARVSTEKQEKQETVESQLEALRSFAKANDHVIVEEYVDNGFSGDMLDRPALDRLRDDIQQKKLKAVLFHSPDRLARRYAYQEIIREEFRKYNVQLIFLNRPNGGDSPEDNLLNGVQGLIAEYEKAKILERTRRGRLYKAKKGILVTSGAPYGYKYIFQDKINNKEGYYEINPEEAVTVRLIFDLFVDKQISIRGVTRELTQRKILPRKGRHWRTSTLHKIVRNETYTGVAHYNKHMAVEPASARKGTNYRRRKNSCLKIRPRDQWIPITLPEHLKIIDNKTFEAAQRQLKRNTETSPRNVKYRYLLRGLLQCGECSSPYSGTPCHGKLYYRCGNRHRTFPLPKNCQAPSLSAPILENMVWLEISNAIKQPRLIIEQIKKLQLSRVEDSRNAGGELENVEAALVNIQNEENRLLEAYRKEVITLEQLKDHMSKIQVKKSFLYEEKQKLTEVLAQSIPEDTLERNVEDYCHIIEARLKNVSFEEKQQILRLLIDKIVLEKDTVRIKGVISVYEDSGSIASTVVVRYGRRLPLPLKPFSPNTALLLLKNLFHIGYFL